MRYRIRARSAILLSTTVILGLAVVGSVGTAANRQPTIVTPYGATDYKYQVVAVGAGVGFEQPGFDDSAFALGDAAFGTLDAGCPLNNPTNVKTPWPEGTDILVRQEFELPQGATNVVVSVAIDNDVSVFVNGYDISSDDNSGDLQRHEGCASRDSFTFAAPDGILHVGPNLLALRGRDRGIATYLDVQVTADIPTITTLGRATVSAP
jgi:hypothetical protein